MLVCMFFFLHRVSPAIGNFMKSETDGRGADGVLYIVDRFLQTIRVQSERYFSESTENVG